MAGTLYLVATPIGNLGDLTVRARDVLAQVSFIACEDTRHSRILLDHYGISKDLVSLPAFAEGERAGRILDRIEAGDDCALVTDAGSPAVSDPGEKLVSEALARGFTVTTVPGPSAVVAALSASGLPTGRFHFAGFLPRKGPDRRDLLDELAPLQATLVFYESPRRVHETLEDLIQAFGPHRRAVVARELTKLHEEFVRGTLAELAVRYRDVEVLGEVVILVEGRTGSQRWSEDEVKTALTAGLSRGEKLKVLATDVAKRAGWTSQDVYRIGVAIKNE